MQVVNGNPVIERPSWIEAPPPPPSNATFLGCALEQAPLWTIFRNLDLRLNQEPINNNYGTYGIQAASFTNLWFQTDWRRSTGECIGYFEEHNYANLDVSRPCGLQQRYELTKESHIASLKGVPFHGIFQQ